MRHQHSVAVDEDYSFLRTPAEVRRLAGVGALVAVAPDSDLALSGVSYAFARPEVRSFVEHLAASYHAATGQPLIVTSLTRPQELQPKNAHVLSVHPAGMAVDLRVPSDAVGRAFLERTLLAMEHDGVLDVTREHTPPHYHVAVFAEQYLPYAARLDSATAAARVARDEHARATADSARPATVGVATPEHRPVPRALAGLFAVAGITVPVARRARRQRRQRERTADGL
jgi:hypothetical protein